MRFLIIILLFLWVQSLPATNEKHLFSVGYDDTEIEQYSDVKIELTSGNLHVENLPFSGNLQIYTVLGELAHSVAVQSGSGNYAVNLRKGYYIVKIRNLVRRVVVR